MISRHLLIGITFSWHDNVGLAGRCRLGTERAMPPRNAGLGRTKTFALFAYCRSHNMTEGLEQRYQSQWITYIVLLHRISSSQPFPFADLRMSPGSHLLDE